MKIERLLLTLFPIILFLLGGFFALHPNVYAQICNPLAGGQCVSGSCDGRTQNASTDACIWPYPPNCCYPKSSYPSSCQYYGYECQCELFASKQETSNNSSVASMFPMSKVDAANYSSYSCTDYKGSQYQFNCGNSTPICTTPNYVTCEDATQDTVGYCSKLGRACNSLYTSTYANQAAQNDCSNYGGSLCCTFKQDCNNGIQQGTCQPNSMASNTCGDPGGSINLTYTTYIHNPCNDAVDISNYTCNPSPICNQKSAGSKQCSPGFQDNCNRTVGYSCSNQSVCTTTISVNVTTDYNHDGTKDGADAGKSGVTISDNGGNTPTTDANGNVTFTQKAMGNYTITMTTPTNFQVTASSAVTNTGTNNDTTASPSNNATFNLGTGNGNEQVTFLVTPLYSISGYAFNDYNKNGKMDGTEPGIANLTVSITGGPTTVSPITTGADGSYATPTNLLAGTYTVSISGTALGYTFTNSGSYQVTVGNPAGSPVCSTGNNPDAQCGSTNNGSITNLDIGLTNENVSQQSVCLDVRNDNTGGTYSDPLPASMSCGGNNQDYATISNGSCRTGSGVVFSCDGSFDFGLGSANANNWAAGGPLAGEQECYGGTGLDALRVSYDYLTTTARESNITPIDMATVCGGGGLGSCTLPSDLPKGIYSASGPVTLVGTGIPATYTFPQPADPTTTSWGYIFLINGTLTIKTNVVVPQGSVAVFATSGDIHVDPSVGQSVTAATVGTSSVNDANIEGVYSTDGSFYVDSAATPTSPCNADGTPLDNKLNIVGIVIPNAAKKGGSFVNNRDLCVYDTQCPTINAGDDINNPGLVTNYLLNLYAAGFLNHKVFNWEEVKP